MQPNYSTNSTDRSKPWLRTVMLVVGIVLLLLIGFTIYSFSKFHLVKTDPKLSTVSQYSTGVTLYFNKTLNSKSLKVYDPGALLSKKVVHDKTIVFSFAQAVQVGKSYKFFITSIKSQGGTELTNISIGFTVKNIPFDKLSAAEQKKVASQQDQFPYAVQNIDYSGFDNLIDQGLTSGEVLDIQTDIFNYSNQVKQKYWTVALAPSSLVIKFHDPTAREANSSSATFTVTLGGSNFTVRSEYDGISDTTYTRIYDPSGAVVYDSSAQ